MSTEPIKKCRVATLEDHNTRGLGDFDLDVSEAEIDRILNSEEDRQVLSGVPNPPFADIAPKGTYKKVEIQGESFDIIGEIKPDGNGNVTMTIERIERP